MIPFGKAAGPMREESRLGIQFGADTAFSLPVAIRRDTAQYDALFLYRLPEEEGGLSPRPFAWVMLDVETGQPSLFCRCDLVDFMPGERYPMDHMLPMNPPKGMGKKYGALLDKLLGAYEEIRAFAFEENLTRQQAGAVSNYKELFGKLIYPSHYPFYHGLSPAFFHWLRMPLPKEALQDPNRPATNLQQDGYQLLILENLQQLVRQFQEKIAVDSHKEQLFDQLHRELQDYKNDLLGSLTQAMERDIIQLIDNVGKAVALYRDMEPGEDSFHKLLGQLAGVETDLCDLLYRQGIEPYTLDAVDVSRQKILTTVPTDDPALDKTIAGRLGQGWEKDGKIIRPERISVYLHNKGEL